ncbi:MAG: DNA polymerase III subunit gamma/tau [Candidatus Dojkabacteria bacterium]
MADVLYRKYRSRDFGEIIGQERIVRVLQASIKAGRPAHAYLFNGPRGTGKTSTARIFARELNGIPKEDSLENYVDIIEIDAASNRGINEIRGLKERVAFAPAQLDYKIYIIDEVHMLTREAFNAVLKTLEEPPVHTIFILATTEIYKIPATILSRVVKFDFQLASEKDLEKKLSYILGQEGQKMEPEGLRRLIKLAKGSYRDAESLLEKVINISDSNNISSEEVYEILGLLQTDSIEKILTYISTGDTAALLADLDNFFASGANPQQLIYDLAEAVLEQIVAGERTQSNYKLISTLQSILANYNQYLDPYLSIKLELAAHTPSSQPEKAEQLKRSEQPLHNLAKKRSEGENNRKQRQHERQKQDQKQDQKQGNQQKEQEQNQYQNQSQEHGQDQQQVKAADNALTGAINMKTDTGIQEKLVAVVKSKDSRIGTMVGQGTLVELSAGSFKLLVPYKFHLKLLNSGKAKQLMISSLTSITGESEVSILCEQDSSSIKQHGKSSNAAQAPSKVSNEAVVEELFADIIKN